MNTSNRSLGAKTSSVFAAGVLACTLNTGAHATPPDLEQKIAPIHQKIQNIIDNSPLWCGLDHMDFTPNGAVQRMDRKNDLLMIETGHQCIQSIFALESKFLEIERLVYESLEGLLITEDGLQESQFPVDEENIEKQEEKREELICRREDSYETSDIEE